MSNNGTISIPNYGEFSYQKVGEYGYQIRVPADHPLNNYGRAFEMTIPVTGINSDTVITAVASDKHDVFGMNGDVIYGQPINTVTIEFSDILGGGGDNPVPKAENCAQLISDVSANLGGLGIGNLSGASKQSLLMLETARVLTDKYDMAPDGVYCGAYAFYQADGGRVTNETIDTLVANNVDIIMVTADGLQTNQGAGWLFTKFNESIKNNENSTSQIMVVTAFGNEYNICGKSDVYAITGVIQTDDKMYVLRADGLVDSYVFNNKGILVERRVMPSIASNSTPMIKYIYGEDQKIKEKLVLQDGKYVSVPFDEDEESVILQKTDTDEEEKEDTVTADVVSVDYEFVNSNINELFDLSKNSSILQLNNVTLDTGGSLTFLSANEYFNNYVFTSKQLLLECNHIFNGVLQSAESMLDLDAGMAESIDGTEIEKHLNYILNIDLQEISQLYEQVPVITSNFGSSGTDIKITKQMLIDASSDRNLILSAISNDINDTRAMQERINQFISESKGVLEGEVWDKFRAKLTEVVEVYDLKCTYGQSLIDNMKIAYINLLNYLGGYDELDTSKLEEVKTRIKQIENDINNLEHKLRYLESINGTPIYGTDENGKSKIEGYIDVSAEINETQNQIELAKEILAMLIDWKLKLEGLPAEDMNASEVVTSPGNAQTVVNPAGDSLVGDGAPGTLGGNVNTNNQVSVPGGSGPITEGPNVSADDVISQAPSGTNQDNNTSNDSNTSGNGATGPSGGSIGNSGQGVTTNQNGNIQNNVSNNNNQVHDSNINNNENSTNNNIIIDNQGTNDETVNNNNQTVKPDSSNPSVTPPINNNATTKKDNGVLKTLGKILGIGGAAAAVGGGIYATKKQIDKNNDTDDEK